MQTNTHPTAEQLAAKRRELRNKGINLRALCKEKKVSYQAARDLLRGRARGLRGNTHKAAIMLGLKSAPESTELTPAES